MVKHSVQSSLAPASLPTIYLYLFNLPSYSTTHLQLHISLSFTYFHIVQLGLNLE